MRRLLAQIIVTGLLSTLVIGVAGVAGAATEAEDTCTAVPESGPVFDFTQACVDHDQCYVDRPYGGGAAARKQCDEDFYWNMIDSCRADWPRRGQWLKRGSCYAVAAAYYLGVRALGGLAWSEGRPPPLA